MATRPNILVVQADQLTALALSAYSKPLAHTPNIDRVAEAGTVYANTYCNNPVCGPSRASMLTGRLPSEVSVFDNGADFASSEPTLAHYLRHLGYDTTLIGKMHFIGPDQLHGFSRRLTTDIYPGDFSWTADWRRTHESYAPSRITMHSVVDAGLCQRSLQIDYDEAVAHAACQELWDLARRAEDTRPSYTHVSFTHPHNPFVTTRAFWDLYEGVDIPGPEAPGLPVDQRDAWSRRYFLNIRQDEFDITNAQVARARRGYLAMISYFDNKLGQILDILEETGTLDKTVVIVTSDHGEMMGERGMWYKFTPFEHSVRVPLIAMGPGIAAGAQDDRLAALVDLLPTLTDIASDGEFTDFQTPLDGRSLLSPALPYTDQQVFIESTGEALHAPALITVKSGHKLVLSRSDPPMLFDLKADPLEQANVAGTGLPVEAELRASVEARWDEPALAERVRQSQRKRIFIQQALAGSGSFPDWDYAPPFDASRAYVRGAVDPDSVATKARRRFPYVQPAVPQSPRQSGT